MNKVLFLFLFVISLFGHGQNLVPNGSFEENISCESDRVSNIKFIPPWFEPAYPGGFCSFLLSCSKNLFYTVPTNIYGWQYARTGKNYISTGDYAPQMSLRRYPEIKLKDSLKTNKEYCIRWYVSLSDYSGYAISNLGMYFSTDTLIEKVGNALINVQPQVENSKDSIIYDTTNWVAIEGKYIATGGEQFITIGCFTPDSLLNIMDLKGDIESYAGYYIDDVAVWECDAPIYTAEAGNDTVICIGDSIMLGSHNLDEYIYMWLPAEGLSDTSLARPYVKPTTTTKYYLHVKDFKFDETIDSITVTVSDRCDTLLIGNGELRIDNENVMIFPNPANDRLYIKTTSKKPNIFVEISNIYGQLIINYQLSIINSIATVNVSYLDRGIYFVKINGVAKRFVKL